LAPYLSPEQVGDALAKRYEDPWLLGALARHQAPDKLGGVLAAAVGIKRDDMRSLALVELAPFLTPDQLAEALAAAVAINDAKARSEALAGLVPHLTTTQLIETVKAAIGIDEADARLQVVAKLAHLGEKLPPAIQVEATLTLIDAAGTASRPAALSAAAQGSVLTFRHGGERAVLELCRAINDVCRWYS
jgi:hypothetical protein